MKRKEILFCLFFILLFQFVYAQELITPNFSTAGFYDVENSPRKVFNFNPGWRFFKGDVAGAEAADFDDSKWEAANLPHGLEILGENASGGRNYQGIAWYRKQFSIEDNNAITFVYFEAVMGKTEVWVNGQKVAEHYGGYLPFTADISNVLNSNGKNIIAVKADNSDSKLYPPGKNQDGLDFTYLGGIYREAYLIQTSNIHVTIPELSKEIAGGGVFVGITGIEGNNAELEVRTEISNSSNKKQSIIVKTILEDAEFNPIQSVEQKISLKTGTSKQISKKLEVKDVHFWHPDDPYLHYIRTEVSVNGKIVDNMRTRVGIRLFEMRGPGGLYINKKPYEAKLIGVNRHQDYTYVGNALPNSGQWRDVKLLREGGSRIIRAGHYPQDAAFYDACDELGMLTTTATPGWHFFNFKAPIFEERLYQDTRNLVRRDRNIASMLMWETALNETPSQPDHVMNNMHKIAHDEYPFPGMFTVTDYHEAKKAGLDMYYHGNDSLINSFTREYGDGGEVDNWHSQNATTRVKMEWGEKPLLTQAIMQANVLNGLYSTSKVRLGGAKWAGIDHQRGYHPDPFWGGLLNGLRIPKYLYYVYKSQYSPDYKVPGIETGPMLFVANELTQISPEDVVVFSNCDEIRITWLDDIVVTQKPSKDRIYQDMPHPPFIFDNLFDFAVIKSKWRSRIPEVKMIIEGIINEEVVLKEVKDYAEQSQALSLDVSYEGMQLTADGSDFVPVRATVIDSKGNKKVLASEQVYFEVEGPAEIIGGKANFGNPAKTEFGVATVLIRANTKPGTIKIRAHSHGLKSAEITIKSKPYEASFLFDNSYSEASVRPNTDATVIIQQERSDMPMDILELHKEIKELRIKVIGKDQDLMELRSRLKDE